jgi:hypothetical protein
VYKKSGTKSEIDYVLRDNVDYEEVDVREAEGIMKHGVVLGHLDSLGR